MNRSREVSPKGAGAQRMAPRSLGSTIVELVSLWLLCEVVAALAALAHAMKAFEFGPLAQIAVDLREFGNLTLIGLHWGETWFLLTILTLAGDHWPRNLRWAIGGSLAACVIKVHVLDPSESYRAMTYCLSVPFAIVIGSLPGSYRRRNRGWRLTRSPSMARSHPFRLMELFTGMAALAAALSPFRYGESLLPDHFVRLWQFGLAAAVVTCATDFFLVLPLARWTLDEPCCPPHRFLSIPLGGLAVGLVASVAFGMLRLPQEGWATAATLVLGLFFMAMMTFGIALLGAALSLLALRRAGVRLVQSPRGAPAEVPPNYQTECWCTVVAAVLAAGLANGLCERHAAALAEAQNVAPCNHLPVNAAPNA